MEGICLLKDLTTSGGVDGLLGEQWAHVVCTYDHALKLATMYINGVKMFQQDYNLYGDPMDLATGLVWAGATGNNSLLSVISRIRTMSQLQVAGLIIL